MDSGVELIQHYWIPNRSFDLGDVLADMTGAVGRIIVLGEECYIKK